MQATQAPNETRLPRAVLKVSNAIKAHIEARNESKQDPADPNAPPAEPSAQAANPVEPKPPATDPRENDPAYWKQRFDVVSGVLKAERNGRKTDAEAFHQQLSELREQIHTLQTTQVSNTQVDLGQFFTPEQINVLGEEEATAIANANLVTVRKAISDAINTEIKPLRDAAKASQAQQIKERKEKFTDKLAELIPNYEAIDAGDDWKAWLAEEDESTGVERQAILDTHIGKLDATKVAGMFRMFLKTKTPSPPPISPNGTGATSGNESAAASSNTAGLLPPTTAEIKDYYKRAALRKVTDQERVQFEARLKLRAPR
jgi:hypothetical protein